MVEVRGNNKAQDTLVDTLAVPFDHYWRPTKDNYLGRLSIPQMFNIFGEGLRADGWCENMKNKKKTDVIADMEDFFSQEVEGTNNPALT